MKVFNILNKQEEFELDKLLLGKGGPKVIRKFKARRLNKKLKKDGIRLIVF